jgi:hypothetical protein
MVVLSSCSLIVATAISKLASKLICGWAQFSSRLKQVQSLGLPWKSTSASLKFCGGNLLSRRDQQVAYFQLSRRYISVLH